MKSAVLLAAVLLALVVFASHEPHAARAAFIDSDGDGSIDVAELIGGSDPNDPASSPESAGGEIYLGEPLCTDGVDNDIDGDTDGADEGCVDSDGDLADDPVENNFGSDANNAKSLPEHSMVDAVLAYLGFIQGFCADGLDNDLDGDTDGADSGCAPFDSDEDGFADVTEKTLGSDPYVAGSVPEDIAANPGSCGDSIDNDGDGATDGADAGCAGAPTPTATAPGTTAVPILTATATPEVSALPSAGRDGGGDASSVRPVALAIALGGLAFGGLALRLRQP